MAERKVLFFKLRVHEDEIEEQARTFEATCSAIARLSTTQRKYVLPQDGPEEYIRLMSFEKRGDYYRGYFAKYRSGNMVAGRDNSDDAEDYTLADGRKPIEITHFIYIPAHYLLAVEYNHHGPKYSHFVNYVNALQRFAHLEQIRYIADTVYHPDALSIIRKAKEIKTIELTAARVNIPTGSGLKRLRQAFESLANIGRPGKLTLTLTAGRGDSVMSGDDLADLLTDADGNHADLDGAKVRAVLEEGMAPQLVNLLQNKIDSKINIPTGGMIAAAETVFDQIWSVYLDNQRLLLKASDEKYDS